MPDAAGKDRQLIHDVQEKGKARNAQLGRNVGQKIVAMVHDDAGIHITEIIVREGKLIAVPAHAKRMLSIMEVALSMYIRRSSADVSLMEKMDMMPGRQTVPANPQDP